jgi:hypothetical protein
VLYRFRIFDQGSFNSFSGVLEPVSKPVISYHKVHKGHKVKMKTYEKSKDLTL